ncbi:hypothetical protein ACIBEJ_45265 [Nonomuraea sp. NPDC050790]|uniref:hypothetical protein n=1 Tax=Nonomuraea sp. NPDC050790 TaxID=3364371 RepID=UPI00379B8D81
MKLEIDWKPYFTDTEYGMVGEIKAFSIVQHGRDFTLYPRLPDRKGLTSPSEEFGSCGEAKARADQLLIAFLKDFLVKMPSAAKSAAVSAAEKAS